MAIDFYLTLDGIAGENSGTPGVSKNPIRPLSFSLSGTPVSSQEVAGVLLNTMTITKVVDQASPKLMQILCMAEHIARGSLTAKKAGTEEKYYELVFAEIFVTRIESDVSREFPTETVTFSFAKSVYRTLG